MTVWPPGLTAWRIALVLMGVAFATSVLPRFGIAPDVLAVLVVSVGISAGAVHGAFAGLAVGWLVDLAPPGGHPLGFSALAYLLVGLLGGVAARWWRTSVLAPALITAAAAATVQALRLAVRLAEGSALPVADGCAIVVLTAVLGAIALPPLVFWQRRLAQRGMR